MLCPVCSSPGGFHTGRCYDYQPTPEQVGPGNSKEFMAFLRKRVEDERSKA